MDHLLHKECCGPRVKELYTLDAGPCSVGLGLLDISFFSGKSVHSWLTFRNADGSMAADSVYAGCLVLGTGGNLLDFFRDI